MTTQAKPDLRGQSSRALADEAVKLLIEKLALDVRMFNVIETTAVTDFYVNATGKSFTHVASLADNLAEHIAECGVDALRIEGKRGAGWILVDFGDVIVNIFDAESRGFYSFDRLLPPECECSITTLVQEVDDKFAISKINI